MTHEKLLANINDQEFAYDTLANALQAVVELHKPFIREDKVVVCFQSCNHHLGYAQPYPCPTIQAIEKELN
jgi:hypothetical protein